MKRLVAIEARVPVISVIVTSLIFAFTNPGPDAAFLIAAAVVAIGSVFILAPDWRQLRCETREHRGPHRR